jgi:hypothetical protein
MLYYFAAWTDSGCLLGCDHKHETVTEAVNCISCAGSYVVAVENGVYRGLSDSEEMEFQHGLQMLHAAPPIQPAELEYEERGYAVMIRVRFVDGWGWDTWMRYETYEEAATHARECNKIVPFGSAEWNALRQTRESALPGPAYPAQKDHTSPTQNETMVEYVSRIVPSPIDPHPANRRTLRTPVKPSKQLTTTEPRTFVESVLNCIDRCEMQVLERIYSLQASATVRAVRKNVRKALARK